MLTFCKFGKLSNSEICLSWCDEDKSLNSSHGRDELVERFTLHFRKNNTIHLHINRPGQQIHQSRTGNMARTLRDIPASVLVSVVILTFKATQEVHEILLRMKSTLVTTCQTHKYCHLALESGHSFCTQGLSTVHDSVILLDKSFWRLRTDSCEC